jgi:transcriptional regulator with XRE-family HTH domain
VRRARVTREQAALSRAALARELGVDEAAARCGVSSIAIRRALRDAAELSPTRRLLALLEQPTTTKEGHR